MRQAPQSPTVQSIRALALKHSATPHVAIADDIGESIRRLKETIGEPEPGTRDPVDIPLQVFVAEFCFAAVNFGYWEGSSGNKPHGGSTVVRREIFASMGLSPFPTQAEWSGMQYSSADLYRSVRLLAKDMAKSPLVMSAERSVAIDQVASAWGTVISLYADTMASRLSNDSVSEVCEAMPGFRDEFGKRAILFFMLLDRIHGLAQRLSAGLPLASDYQVPKVLRYGGALTYSPALAAKVDAGELLEHQSDEERAIRGSSIVVVGQMAERLKISEADVDEWLWCARHQIPGKHHLTRTTAY